MPSVNGYVAFFDVSVSPSNNDENDDDEGEEKEEKHDDDEEGLAAFRLYLFFYPPFFPPLLFLSILSLAIYLFLSCSGELDERGWSRTITSYTREHVFFHHDFRHKRRPLGHFFFRTFEN